MAIDVICDNCFESYRVKDDRAGSTLKCKNCGKPIQVPTGTAPALPQRRSASSGSQRSKASSQSHSSSPPWLLIGSVGGGLILIVLLAVIFLGGDDDKPGGNGVGAGTAPGEGVADDGESPNGGWLVTADPPAAAVQLPTGQQIAIPIPSGAAQDWAIYPKTPSTFVALGSNFRMNDVREIWNLSSGQKIGTVQTDIGADRGALSPDGKYFTGMAKSKDKLLLFDTVQSKQIAEIPIGAGTISPETRFAGNSKLVTLRRNQPLKVWELPSGKELFTIELPKFFDLYSLTVSPSGKYAALVVKDDDSGKKVLRIFDLKEAQLAGELNLDAFVDKPSMSCECLTFSPDGAELASVLKQAGSNTQSWLIAWNLETGQVAFKHQFPSALENQAHSGTNDSQDARWFPDQKWLLLFGRYIFDRETGGPIWTLPQDPELTGSETNVLSNDQVLVVSGPYQQRQLRAIPLDPNQIAMSAAAVQAGGLAEDAGLPPLTTFEKTTSSVISLADNASNWQVTADSSPILNESGLDAPVPLEAEIESIGGIFVPRSHTEQILIAQDKSERETRVQVVNLADNSKSSEFTVAFPSQVLAVNPDGSQVLTRLKGSASRLDLWSSDDGKHVAGWRPYQGEGENLDDILAAAFTDGRHVLTLSSGRKLVLWEVPSIKKLYTIENVNQSRNIQQAFVDTIASQNQLHAILSRNTAGLSRNTVGNRGNASQGIAAQPRLNPGLPAISPEGKTLVIQADDRLQFLEAASGKLTGTVDVQGPLTAAAFDPAGTKLAALMLRPAGGLLVTVKLGDGSIADEIPLPMGGTWLHWCHENQLLVDHRYLVDLRARKIVWIYDPATTFFAEHSPGHRLWGAIPRPGAGNALSLAAVVLPSSNESKQFEANTDPPKYLMSPGSGVSVQYTLQAKPSGDPGFESRVKSGISGLLSANGLIEQAASKIVLQVSTGNMSTGRQMTFTPLGSQIQNTAAQTVVMESQIVCLLKLVVDGKEVYQSESRISNLKYGLTRLKPGESIENHLTKQQWESVEKLFSTIAIPKYLFSEADLENVGRANLIAE